MAEKKEEGSDKRFSRLHSDPRFIRPRRKDAKVKLDDRFAAALESKEFSGERKDLSRFYQMEQPDEDGHGEDTEISAYDRARGRGNIESSDEDEAEAEAEKGAAGASRDVEQQAPKEEGEEASVEYGEETSRLALVNVDWDHLTAADIFKLFEAFCPADGKIEVYHNNSCC